MKIFPILFLCEKLWPRNFKGALYVLYQPLEAQSLGPAKRIVKLRCDERFTHAFTACSCVFTLITLVGVNHGNFFENATVCSSKRMRKTLVATQLKIQFSF